MSSPSLQLLEILNLCPFPLEINVNWKGADGIAFRVWSQNIYVFDPEQAGIGGKSSINLRLNSSSGVSGEMDFTYDAGGKEGTLEVRQENDKNLLLTLNELSAMVQTVGARMPVPALGQGFDTLTDTIKTQVLNVKKTNVTGGSGNRFEFLVEYDYHQLRDKLDIKTHVSGETAVTKVDLSVDVSTELHEEDMSVFLIHRVKAVNEVESIIGSEPSERTKSMVGKPLGEIFSDLGNVVITDIEKGGEILLMAIFKSRTREQSMKIKTKLEGKTEIFSSKVNFDAAVESLRSEVSKHISYSVSAKWNGGSVDKYDDLINPATATTAINAWKASLDKKPVIIGFSCKDLKEANPSFGAINKKVLVYQNQATELKNQARKLKTTADMVRQYQKTRTDMWLPPTTVADATGKEAQKLLEETSAELLRMSQSAMDSFTPTADLIARTKACIRKAPIFSYVNEGISDWGGYGNSGMPLRGMDTKEVKYITEMHLYGGSYGINGISIRYKDFSDNEILIQLGPQGGNQEVSAHYSNEVLGRLDYWGLFRDRWMAVGGLALNTNRGRKFGPCGHSLPNPETSWGNTGTAGQEVYIVGIWVRAEGWVQQIGPHYRRCFTTYPYEME